MSDTPNVEALQAEIDRLNSELTARNAANDPNTPNPAAAAAAAVNETPQHGPSVFREPGGGATVVGAAGDPRGGTVLGYSDGTVKLVNVPAQGANNEPAQPWGSAPEGEYSQFYVDENGDRYNWIASDGTTVASVDNPNVARP